jgi:hypothetical protein
MANLFSKDDDLARSAPIIGFEILKLIKESDDSRVSIFDIAKKLRKTNQASARSIYFGMIFLYSLDIVDFNEPYLIYNDTN